MQCHHHHGLGLMRRSASIRFRQLSAQQPWNGPVDRRAAFSQGDVLFVGIVTVRRKAAYCRLYTTQASLSVCHFDIFLDNSYYKTKPLKSRELKVKMFLCKPKGPRARLNYLWHACPKWQAERFFLARGIPCCPKLFYFCWPTSVSILWRKCVQTHTHLTA
jgi:hypothetical protein